MNLEYTAKTGEIHEKSKPSANLFINNDLLIYQQVKLKLVYGIKELTKISLLRYLFVLLILATPHCGCRLVWGYLHCMRVVPSGSGRDVARNVSTPPPFGHPYS